MSEAKTQKVHPLKFKAKVRLKASIVVAERVEKRRAQITRAASELFGEKGYHVTTVRDIAKRANVSIGLIYQYADDKEEVLFFAIQDLIESHKHAVKNAISTFEDPLEIFCAVFRWYCEVIDSNIEASVLAYRETKSLKRANRRLIMQGEVETNELIVKCIEECVRAEVFQEDTDVELFTYQMVMFAHAWALKSWRLRSIMSINEYIERGLKMTLRGVLTTRGKERALKMANGVVRSRKSPS